ncbi:MAG: hypothetical protein OQK80_01755, partial [Sedimenticola sp.]|nr:hypothetical protein [Sedimenticola sp.]
YNRVGVTKIFNSWKYNNENYLIENTICIINGMFHGIYFMWQSREHRYHEEKLMLTWYQRA